MHVFSEHHAPAALPLWRYPHCTKCDDGLMGISTGLDGVVKRKTLRRLWIEPRISSRPFLRLIKILSHVLKKNDWGEVYYRETGQNEINNGENYLYLLRESTVPYRVKQNSAKNTKCRWYTLRHSGDGSLQLTHCGTHTRELSNMRPSELSHK